MSIELYDISLDKQEQNNVAMIYPKIVEKISQIMIQSHSPSPIMRFKFPQLGD